MENVKMRAKIKIQSVEEFEYLGKKIKGFPVCGNKPFGPNGESEDNTFARYTPSGSVELFITNPELTDKLKAGMVFYLDFTEVDEKA